MKLSEKMNGISTNVNLLRFIAAVLVIFSHSFYVAATQQDPFVVFCGGQTNFGGVAVAIFFFLSGFYVTKSLYKKNDAKEFLQKRCLRIFPQLWLVVAVSVFLLGPIFTSVSLKEYFLDGSTYLYLLNGVLIPVHDLPGVFINNVYSTTVNGSLWTMPVEFFAYCIMAAMLVVSKYVLKNEKSQKSFHVAGVCGLLVVFIGLDMFVKNDFMITVLRPMIVFGIGVIYCDYADKIQLNKKLAFLMLMIIGLSCKFGMLNYSMMLCLPYVVVTFVLGTKQVKFKSKILLTSYEMYLLAWPIQQIITKVFDGKMNPYLNFLMTLPIDIIFAFGLFIVIEKRGKKNG